MSVPEIVFTDPVYRIDLADTEQINQALTGEYRNAVDQQKARQTHHFMGRFENTYVNAELLPSLQQLLPKILNCVATILSKPAEQLRYGFWFNEMQPGHKTSLHTHEEEDELLSAVYYLTAPKESGNLVVKKNDDYLSLEPKAGRLYLFGPEVPHLVERNRSQSTRLSLAFNFGPLDND